MSGNNVYFGTNLAQITINTSTNGGSATNVYFSAGQNTAWTTVGGSNQVNLTWPLAASTATNAQIAANATNAQIAATATNTPNGYPLASEFQLSNSALTTLAGGNGSALTGVNAATLSRACAPMNLRARYSASSSK